MRVAKTYSFKGGERYLQSKRSGELRDVFDVIKKMNAISCLTKKSAEKTMRGALLFSPKDMNDFLALSLCRKGWMKKSVTGKGYSKPRHSFGEGRFREMDGIKNKVGLEIQFGKYAFMGYDIFSKMVIFKNLGYITCGIEVVPTQELSRHMSTGVSSFEQLLIDFENRGESDIDIPVLVVGIGLTDREKEATKKKQGVFRGGRK